MGGQVPGIMYGLYLLQQRTKRLKMLWQSCLVQLFKEENLIFIERE